MLVKAKVVKRDTADGVSFLRDEVPIGFVYYVDPSSKTNAQWGDLVGGTVTTRESICVYGAATGTSKSIGFMPTELLEIEDVIQ